MKKHYDLVIALRTYTGSKISRSRAIYKENKYALVDLCLKSLKDSLGSLKVKFFALLDSCPPKWEEIFRKYFKMEDLEIINLNRAGEIGSIRIAFDILLEQNYSNIIFMAEDDYFYISNQFEKMIQFINNPNVDFITPYDHIDYYTRRFHDYPSYLRIFGGTHWRTVSTTCNTFLTTKNALSKTRDLFLRSYSAQPHFDRFKNKILRRIFRDFFERSTDADVWLSLTKINLFRPFRILKYRFQYQGPYIIYFKAWRYNWKQILTGKKWKLWCPIPSIATHMEKNVLAPTINWYDLFKKQTEIE